MSKNLFFNILDKAVHFAPAFLSLPLSRAGQVVRSTAVYFMSISYWVLPLQHLILVVTSCCVALVVYIGFSRHSQCRTQTHVIVHVASNIGVLFYTAGLVARRQSNGNS
jgi:hypothetical protein